MEGNCTNKKQCSFIDTITTNRSWVFVDSTNINIFGVHFIGPQNSWAVVRPRGRFTVKNCSFTELSSGLWEYDQYNTSNSQNHIIVVVEFPGQKWSKKTQLVLTIDNTKFEGVSYLPTTSQKGSSHPVIYIRSKCQLKDSNVNITISSCVFKRCPAVEVDVLEDPGLDIKIDKCLIDGNVTKKFAREWLSDHQTVFDGSAIRLHLRNAIIKTKKKYTCSIASPEFIESISGIGISWNNFTKLASGQGSAIVIYSSGSVNCSIRSVTIENNTFVSNYGLYYRSVIYADAEDSVKGLTSYSRKSRGHFHMSTMYRIILTSNVLLQNFKEDKFDKHCILYSREIPKYISEVHELNNQPLGGQAKHHHCVWQAVIYLSGYSHWRVLLDNNTIEDNYEGGLKLYHSVVQLRGRNRIRKCSNYHGGGISIVGDSQLLLEENTFLEITENRAYVLGGGFFIQDLCMLNNRLPDTCLCFFQLVHNNGTSLEKSPMHSFNRSVVLSENKARNGKMGAATMLFNSNIDKCILKTNFTQTGNSSESDSDVNIEVFRELFNLRTDHAYNSSEISSIPRKICMCGESGQIVTCDLENHPPLEYYPGQRLKVNIAILGDMDIHLSNVLYVDLEKNTFFNHTYVYVPLYLHSTNFLESKCNEIILPPLPMISDTRRYNYYLQLRVPLLPDALLQETGTTYLTDFIRTSRYDNSVCPDGFEFNSKLNECQCHQRLREHGFECSLDDLVIKPPENTSTWLGRRSANSTPLIWSFQCPHVLCNHTTQVPINNYDAQCKHNRTGILCGQCPEGYSTLLWSNRCEVCTNWSLLYLLALLIAGPLLIIIIGALNLTVTVGSINGIMYYITILVINIDALESRIQLCFYNGMTDFERTIFTYLPPLYLLSLVGIACCLPRCRCINMHKINRIIGPRITPVLATVIAVSYLFIAFNVITSLLFATLYSTDGSTTVVWLFDGSLTYFQSPQHITLGCIAIIMFLLFILPAALTATFGDLLRRFIKTPWYINFLDTFHGAFRFQFGFWLGIQLLALTLIMILKVILKPQQIYMVIVFMSTAILIFEIIVKPYRGIRIKVCVTETIKTKYFSDWVQQSIANFLDASFHFNILILFICTLFAENDVISPFVISQFVAYMELVIINIYHLLEYTPLGPFLITRTERWYNKWKEGSLRALKRNRQQNNCQMDLHSVDLWEIDDRNDEYDGNHDNNVNDGGINCQRSRFNADNSITPLYRTEYNVHVPTEVRAERNAELNAPLLL